MAKIQHQRPVVITCAVTGSTLTPSMSRYLPVTAERMITQSVDAAKAGAASLHFHAGDPKGGSPTNDPAVWQSFLPQIRQPCDAVINMSCSMGDPAEARASAAKVMKPEIPTVIVGSMNDGRFQKAIDQGFTEAPARVGARVLRPEIAPHRDAEHLRPESAGWSTSSPR